MKTHYVKLLLVLVLLIVFSNLYAQTPGKGSEKFGKHVTLTVLLSPTGKGPYNDLEKNMNGSGFGDTSPTECAIIFCIPETNYPYSGTGLAWRAKLTYHAGSNYGLSMIYSENDFGNTRGYNSEVGRLYIEHNLRGISPQVTFGIYDIISIGAGPALYSLRIRETNNDVFKKDRKVGAEFDFNFRIPKKSLFFVTLDLHFEWVGKYTVGPYSKRLNDSVKTFRETKVNYNTFSIGYGFGIRI